MILINFIAASFVFRFGFSSFSTSSCVTFYSPQLNLLFLVHFVVTALCLSSPSFMLCIRINIIRTSTLRWAILTASFTLHRRNGDATKYLSDLLIKRCVVSTLAEKEIHLKTF